MSERTREVKARVTVCDLCGEAMQGHSPDEKGSLTNGFIAHEVEMPKTKHVFLWWPPESRRRSSVVRLTPERYDFHAQCIYRLVKANVHAEPEESR